MTCFRGWLRAAMILFILLPIADLATVAVLPWKVPASPLVAVNGVQQIVQLALGLAWLGYLHRSVRVRNTFVR